jgi:hypothetical protein
MDTPDPSQEQDRYFPRRKKNETSTEGWFVVISCFLDPAVTVYPPTRLAIQVGRSVVHRLR